GQQAQPLDGQGVHLKITVPRLAADIDSSSRCPGGSLHVVREHEGVVGLEDLEPAVLARSLDAGKDGPSAVQPPVRDGGLAAKGEGVVAEPGGHAGGAKGIAGGAVLLEGLFPRFEDDLLVVCKPGGHGKALEGGGAPLCRYRICEEGPGLVESVFFECAISG